MKRFFKFLGLMAFGACLPMLMAPSGGIPSILSLKKLTITALTGQTPLTVTGAANAYTANLVANSTAGQSFGTIVTAGTNTSDNSFLVRNVSGANSYFAVRGDGMISAGVTHGLVNLNGATCVVSGGPGTFTACAHTGTGTYNITNTGMVSSSPICTVSSQGGFVPLSVAGSSATSVIIVAFNSSFVATDSVVGVNVICVNNI
jgi:hypothetical protein